MNHEFWKNVGMLVVYGIVSFIQSILFTWQSRARNQNDIKFFTKANILAQSAYFIAQATQFGTLWKAVTTGQPWLVVATGVVFVIASNTSAVQTMKYLIKNGR